jgi:ATP-dependent Clp protease ATP-binding subunit ClpC
VDAAQIAEVVSELASVPVQRLLETDGEHLLRLEHTLGQRVVGHTESIAKIARIIRRNAAGLGSSRPIGTFLLLGPSGVGKTETAKALAAALFGTEQAMTRVDLSEYSEAHAVARLIGAPPGYVGHEAGGQLTEAVRRRPYQVLLLDEIEKAHIDVLQAMLPLLDEGRLTDGRGRTVDFTNVLVILTSNLGAREAVSATRTLGFGERSEKIDAASERVLDVARKALPPEFWNRLDETLVFDALSRPLVQEIARRLLQQLADRIFDQREVELQIEPSVVEMLLEEGGFDATLGARPMRRAIARLVEGPLAERLLAGDLRPGMQVILDVSDGKLTLAVTPALALV